MSSEGASAMSEENNEKSALVPRLRFPGFRREDDWDEKKLGDVAVFFKGKGLPKSDITPNGKRPCIHYGELFTEYLEVIESTKSRTDLTEGTFVSAKNDVLMPTSDVTPSGLAKASCLKLEGVILGGDILVIRTDEQEICGEFLARQIRHLERKVLQLVSGSTVFHLYATSIDKLALSVPGMLEQQKIADCLSSLDELITAETQKLDALKTHKKGLMQQLFPRAGETVPRLRFPEFREAGEWEPKTIGDSCESFSGGTPSTTNKSFYGGEIPFIRSAEIDKEETELFLSNEGLENSAAKMVNVGDILVALYGANSGDVALSKINGAINQAILCLRHETNNRFVYQYLAHKKEWIIATFIQGGQGNLSGEIIKAISLFFPKPKEQQCIADCLSALDDLITTQSQKIDALKTHKKGLMQQLFPVLHEVQG